MTLEDRISRIEAALAAAGLMEMSPSPGRDEIISDLSKGDASSLRAYLRKNKGNITDNWPFGKSKGKP